MRQKNFYKMRAEWEYEQIKVALALHDDCIRQAAMYLGINRQHFYTIMARKGVPTRLEHRNRVA